LGYYPPPLNPKSLPNAEEDMHNTYERRLVISGNTMIETELLMIFFLMMMMMTEEDVKKH
jgi:hypothetical protein